MGNIISESIKKVGGKMCEYLISHSRQIAFVTSAFVCLYASINYDYQINQQHDLIFWMELFNEFMQRSPFIPTITLFVLALIKLQIFSLIVYLYLLVSNCRDERKIQLFAEFIVRRLIAQLDCATQKCDPDINGTEEQNNWYPYTQDIFIAINLFRRDVRKVLHPQNYLLFLSVNDLYYISDQDKMELMQMGYDKLKVKVNKEFLIQICRAVNA